MRFITMFFIFIIVLAVIDTIRRISIAKIRNNKDKKIDREPKK